MDKTASCKKSDSPEVVANGPNGLYSLGELKDLVFDLIRCIRDPEKPQSLEDLAVVYEDGVKVEQMDENTCLVNVEFKPTVSHCHLATLIGLCIRIKVEKNLPQKHKMDISIKQGTHDTGEEITKQINDKERVAAAMENPRLKSIVEECIADES